ncbi:MAG: sel1 repeat family protein [Proteobacteria bacterium]|nr:sel1 repeat family protein [Pseudomonadota bacterium]
MLIGRNDGCRRPGSGKRAFLPALLLACAVASGSCLADLKSGLAQFDRSQYTQAIATLKPLAAHGDVSAQYAMGLASYNQLGMKQNLPDALHWFRLAAAQGLPEAQYCLGVMYARGEGVKASQSTAVAWFKLAAAGGNAMAYYNLGVHYAQGEGAYPDLNTALSYMMVAADLGLAQAGEKRDELTQVVGSLRTTAARRAADRMKAAIRRPTPVPLPGSDSASSSAKATAPTHSIQIRN